MEIKEGASFLKHILVLANGAVLYAPQPLRQGALVGV